jgi:cation-transporting ATPase 13A1
MLAHKMAQANGDILPPPHLPTTMPLIGILTSLALWVAATLLPTWFTSLQVYMNHHMIDSKSVSQEFLMELIRRNSNAVSVFVKVPREQRHLERNAKSHVTCPLHAIPKMDRKAARHHHAHPHPFYFELSHRRIYYSTDGITEGGPVLHSDVSVRDLLRMKGLKRRSELRLAQERFGPYNIMSLPSPTITMAFISRISSPLSVLQLMGHLLTALEEDFKSTLIGLGTTLSHHYWNARTSIVSAKQLAKEVQQSVVDVSEVWVFREDWEKISAVDVLPGDVFVLNAPTVMIADALLLEGSCVANEAFLTGESVPQTKLPLEVEEDDDSHLDMMESHRSSILFAGTTLLHCASDASKEDHGSVDKTPSGPRFLALRTGSYSSRGESMRALARSSGHAGAISNPQTERDALLLIASLSCFAALACASLFWSDSKSPSAFRRVVQCTRIAVASIPSDLPMALSAVAHSCSIALRDEADVVCSEPGSLLTAARVQVVVFDKTGTLTADTQALSRIESPPKEQQSQSSMSEAILAGCHSLVDLVDEATKDNQHSFVGDPLDLASLQYVGWTYNNTQDAFESKKKSSKLPDAPIKLWQIRTFPFDANRRTSCALLLVLHADGTCRLWKAIKGSPDVIQSIVKENQESWYKKQIQKLGGQGLRTIAMAASEVTENDVLVKSLFPNGLVDPSSLSIKERRGMISHARNASGMIHRSSFESVNDEETSLRSFNFSGFACFDAAVRPSTRRIIQELQHANVNVIMLTGDGVDAAISVAGTAGLLSGDSIAVLDFDERANKTLVWKKMRKKSRKGGAPKSRLERERIMTVNEKSVETMLAKARRGRCTLVVMGKAAEFLLSGVTHSDSEVYSRLEDNLFRFAIFARASPKQKRAVVSSLKDHSGMKVLMCGTLMTRHEMIICFHFIDLCVILVMSI